MIGIFPISGMLQYMYCIAEAEDGPSAQLEGEKNTHRRSIDLFSNFARGMHGTCVVHEISQTCI